MAAIRHPNDTVSAAFASAESARQQAIAAAVRAGGTKAVVDAAVKAGDIAYYRSIIAAAKASGQPYANFLQTLTGLGADIV